MQEEEFLTPEEWRKLDRMSHIYLLLGLVAFGAMLFFGMSYHSLSQDLQRKQLAYEQRQETTQRLQRWAAIQPKADPGPSKTMNFMDQLR